MSLDHLLLWLSAKGEGSWPQFRGAVERLLGEQDDQPTHTPEENGRSEAASELPEYQQARVALERLGHVEFDSNGGARKWRVVPPALALLPGEPGAGLLCGARSPDLLERLDHVDRVGVVKTPAPGMPQRLLVRGTPQSIAAAAAQLGLIVQKDAATAILSAAPGVRDPSTWAVSAIPETPGWTIRRFSSSRLAWVEAASADATSARTGLFRFEFRHQRFHYLRWGGRSFSVPVQVGKYAVMPKTRGVIGYQSAKRVLSVPAICRPPALIERALVLCSGVLHQSDPASGRVEYPDVPPGVARLAAQLLRQELR